jgi:hypothetical protein
LSIGPIRNAGSDGAVYMVLFLDVFPPGLIPTLAAVKDAAVAARKGEGNLRYDRTAAALQPLPTCSPDRATRSSSSQEVPMICGHLRCLLPEISIGEA